MDNMRDALLRLVRAAMDSKRMQKAFLDVGLKDNMIFGIYSEIVSAICKLVGEQDVDFEKSVTCLAIETPLFTEDRRVEMLMAEYRKNHPAQPIPLTVEQEEMRKLFKENGGYLLRETPEGDWS